MRLPDLLQEIPRPVRVAAPVLGGCVALAGFAVAVATRGEGSSVIYGVAGLVGGLVVAAWILGVGFVYADARRRAMRSMLWTALVVLFPHLLGFLLYFVMRQPLAAVCGRCGQTISEQQRFCSWCGASQAAVPGESADLAQERSEGGTR